MIEGGTSLEKAKTPLLLIAIAVLVLIVYSNSFCGKFLYDDKILIPGGFIKSLDFKEVFAVACGQVFPDGLIRGALYRPVLILSYFIDYKFWGANALGYHISNMIFHLANCFLIFFLLKRISGSKALSFITTLLFSIHPVQVESVTWIAGRNELLMSFFMLLALLLYASDRFLLSYLSFLVAAFTKESALFLVVIFVIYDIVFAKVRIRNYIGYILAIIVYLTIRYLALGSMAMGASLTAAMILKNILKSPLYYLNYLKLFFFPAGYSFIPIFLFSPRFQYLYILFTAGIFALLFGLIRKSRILLFALLWFTVSLLSSSGIIQLPWPLMEHRLYFPSIGIFIFIAYGICRLMAAKNRTIAISGLAAFAALLCTLSIVTYDRNGIFSSEVKFWQSTAANNPSSSIARKFLSQALKEQ